jgi:hypothetical protein
MLRLCLLATVVGCSTTPDSSTESCLRFSVLETKTDEHGAVIFRHDMPESRPLAIHRSDVLSASYVRERVPDWLRPLAVLEPSPSQYQEHVAVSLKPTAASVLRQAGTGDQPSVLRIARPSYPSVEAILVDPIEGDGLQITVQSEAAGKQLVEMLTSPCTQAGAAQQGAAADAALVGRS